MSRKRVTLADKCIVKHFPCPTTLHVHFKPCLGMFDECYTLSPPFRLSCRFHSQICWLSAIIMRNWFAIERDSDTRECLWKEIVNSCCTIIWCGWEQFRFCIPWLIDPTRLHIHPSIQATIINVQSLQIVQVVPFFTFSVRGPDRPDSARCPWQSERKCDQCEKCAN